MFDGRLRVYRPGNGTKKELFDGKDRINGSFDAFRGTKNGVLRKINNATCMDYLGNANLFGLLLALPRQSGVNHQIIVLLNRRLRLQCMPKSYRT